MLRKINLLVTVMLYACVSASASELSHSDINTVLNKAQQTAKNIKIPKNKYEKSGMEAAKKVADTYRSDEFQKKIRCEAERIDQEFFQNFSEKWKKAGEKQRKETEKGKNLLPGEKIYLLFSSSVPDRTMQTYISTVAQTNNIQNINFVMRGFVQGLAYPKADTEYFSRITKKKWDCVNTEETYCEYLKVPVSINSEPFSKYQVQRVPAIVYDDGTNSYVIHGDAGLEYLLERIDRRVKSVTLAEVIKKLRGHFDKYK